MPSGPAAVTMYVRFVTPLIDSDTRVECGIFQSRRHLDDLACPQWIFEELEPEWDWFDEWLVRPRRLGIHFRRRNSLWGVCWFRPEAGEAIRRARRCAWLMEEAGLPVRCLVWRGPVQTIWSDEHQVVAVPDERMPRGFH